MDLCQQLASEIQVLYMRLRQATDPVAIHYLAAELEVAIENYRQLQASPNPKYPETPDTPSA
jgi:hypothetical protein